MKNTLILFVLACLFFTTARSQDVSVMTYNIRLDIASDGENAWSNRKDFLLSQIQFHAPDFLGTQEGRPNQIADMKETLKGYDYIGHGRDGGNKGEYSAIFYKKAKFRLEEDGTFWLSETPEKFSKGWDAAYPRICTYGLFTDVKTSQKIWVFNTHLDHVGQEARLQGMKLIQQKIAEINSHGYPVILTGDFNVEPNNLLIEKLSEQMLNTETVAELTHGPKGTFNAFKFNAPVTRTIDYIFISQNNGLKVKKYAVLSDSENLRYPSDHFPVYAEIYGFDQNTDNRDNLHQGTDFDPALEHKVDSVLALMHLNEKIGQLVQYSGKWDATGPSSSKGDQHKLDKLKNGEVGSMLNITSVASVRETQKIVMENSRLKIPLIFGYDVIHGYKTIFPIPLGESASWDLNIMEQSASIAAKEASASGLQWTFAPMIDVSRDARWGRGMEGAGEDTYLNTVIGLARIKGFQGDDLSLPHTLAACAKHFAGYGFAEAGRDYNTVNIGEHELHNVILPPFKAAAEAGVATFMNAFNEIDGVPATGSKALQRDLLKGSWGWDGFVVSDWGSIGEMIAHGYAKDKKHAAQIALSAGSDMDMESYAYEAHLEALLNENKISMAHLDHAVRRVLRVKFRLGLFDDPYRYCNEDREKNEVYSKEHLAIARDAAKKSIVLLKNENDLLPLNKNLKSIAVIGPLANDKDTPLGNWRAKGRYNSAVSLLDGVKKAVGSSTTIYYEKGADLTVPTLREGQNQFLHPLKFNTTDVSGINAAVQAAKKAEVVLLAIGEDAYQTGEGRSQTDIGLFGVQQQLLEAVLEVNKNVVIVLMNGRPMDISWAAEHVPSILECWFLGSESGNAIADVVFGDYNPSGKLPVSFPHNVGQEPLYYNKKNTGRPYSKKHITYSGYTDAPKTALYPFGHGLSYTTFAYENLRLDKTEIAKDGQISVSVDVTNTGSVDGEEVVQLYIRDMVGSITRPIRELKGFEKVMIRAGETKTLSLTINADMLRFYTINKKWEVEPGDFRVFIGGDSQAKLKASFVVRE
ncbi:beta-glucosidase [Saccharicrinis carchari]|uniref:beta-glucosidase n=1 Tax=Saccharicrinis carchari TaxID=1168039 RepID=A0A521B0E2_SACCC|nr:beta-glucosidase BglX [Saccharicrinis carchari]SMO40578.1 beta-glucosidase [Saccharicrinis carchari]